MKPMTGKRPMRPIQLLRALRCMKGPDFWYRYLLKNCFIHFINVIIIFNCKNLYLYLKVSSHNNLEKNIVDSEVYNIKVHIVIYNFYIIVQWYSTFNNRNPTILNLTFCNPNIKPFELNIYGTGQCCKMKIMNS